VSAATPAARRRSVRECHERVGSREPRKPAVIYMWPDGLTMTQGHEPPPDRVETSDDGQRHGSAR
jgi:hypothetical protein